MIRSFFLGLFLSFIFCVSISQAEGLKKSFKLLSGAAAEKVNKKSFRKKRYHSSHSSFSADDLKLETAQDIIRKNVYKDHYISNIQSNLYFRYFTDIVNLDRRFDEFEERHLAEKVFLYEGVKVLTDFALTTSLREYYLASLKFFRTVRDRTTIHVARDKMGSYTIDNQQLGSENSLLEFKIHTSAKRGIEPQLRFDENLTFRYDILDEKALLQFEMDF